MQDSPAQGGFNQVIRMSSNYPEIPGKQDHFGPLPSQSQVVQLWLQQVRVHDAAVGLACRPLNDSPAENGFVQVIGPIGGSKHHDVVGLVCQHAIPKLHELCLESRCCLVLM